MHFSRPFRGDIWADLKPLMPGIRPEMRHGRLYLVAPDHALAALTTVPGAGHLLDGWRKHSHSAMCCPRGLIEARLARSELLPHVWPEWLKPFQKEGIEVVADAGGGLLMWSPGGGKTAGAIVAGMTVPWHPRPGTRNILTITKASVRRRWGREVEKLTTIKPWVSDPDERRLANWQSLQSYLLDCLAHGRRAWVIVGWEELASLVFGPFAFIVEGSVEESMALADVVDPRLEFQQALKAVPGVGPKLVELLTARWDTIEDFQQADMERIARVPGVGSHALAGLLLARPYLTPELKLHQVHETFVRTRFDQLILDECFPAGTPVETATGPKPIEKIEPGEQVWTQDKNGQLRLRPVERRLERARRENLVRVTHAAGSFVCTARHKVWTVEDGYVEAQRLLRDRHHLRVLRQARGEALERRPDEGSALLRQELFCEVACDHTCREGGLQGRGHDYTTTTPGAVEADAGAPSCLVRTDEGTESDGRSGSARPRGGCSARTALPGEARGERNRADEGGGSIAGPAPRCSLGVRCCHPQAREASWLERDELEAGSRLPQSAARDRVRRPDPQDAAGKGARRAEGADPGTARVDRVEVLERGDPGGPGERDAHDQAASVVYDLTVAEDHNYFAAGVLVSNCHTGKAKDRSEWIEGLDGKPVPHSNRNMVAAAQWLCRRAKWRLGTTATFIPNRLRDAWGQLDLLWPSDFGAYWAFAHRYCDLKEGAYALDDTGHSNAVELAWRMGLTDRHGQRVIEDDGTAYPDRRPSWAFASQVPVKVSHGELPAKRREVEVLGFSAQTKGDGDAWADMRRARGTSPMERLEASLEWACTKKRPWILDRVAAEDGKGIIFTGRIKDAERTHKALQAKLPHLKLWLAHGGHSTKERDIIAQEFMAHPGPCVLVATGYSMGTGIDLHDADYMIMAMLPLTPERLEQWEGRVSRQGQKRPVRIIYPIAEGTADEHISDLLLDKLPAVIAITGQVELDEAAEQLSGIVDTEAVLDSILARFCQSEPD